MKTIVATVFLVIVCTTYARHVELKKRQINEDYSDVIGELYPNQFGSPNTNQFNGQQLPNQFGMQNGQPWNQFGNQGNMFNGQGGLGEFPNQFGGQPDSRLDQQAPTAAAPTTTTQPPMVRQCIGRCQTITPEYNPVCGSNRVRYQNQSYLNCARSCGVDVIPASPSNCG